MSLRFTSAINATFLASVLLLTACASTRLGGPHVTDEWRIQTGQAVWSPRPGRPGIAGELMMATNSTGDFVVEFSKPPFVIATARREGKRWEVEFPAENKRASGSGRGPARFIWLHLPAALGGSKSPLPLVRMHEDAWRLQNGDETLEGFLSP